MNRMPHTAFDGSSFTNPRGWYVLSLPSKPPLRNVKVVAMLPSLSSRYDSTALCAPRSIAVGMFAITYQSPMKRGRSTCGAVERGGWPEAQPPSSERNAMAKVLVLIVRSRFSGDARSYEACRILDAFLTRAAVRR